MFHLFFHKETPGNRFFCRKTHLAVLLFAALWTARFVGALHAASPNGTLIQSVNTDPDPIRRLQALKTLQQNGDLDARQIARSLTDTSPAIRAEIIQCAAPFLREDTELQRKILALGNDKSAVVRLTLLRNLALFDPSLIANPLARVLTAQSRSSEGWNAALLTLEDKLPLVVRPLFREPHPLHPSSETSAMFRRLGVQLASRSDWLAAALEMISEAATAPLWQRVAFLEGLSKPATALSLSHEGRKTLEALAASSEPAVASLASELRRKIPKTETKP
jgi:hypothetical protein